MEKMSSLERVKAVLNGQVPDRIPVIPQGFMFAMNEAGYSIGQINRKPAVMAQCHVECREKYGYDGCVMDIDDSTLAEACGAKVKYRDDSVAVVDERTPVLNDLREIDDLQIPDPLKDGRLPEWLETTNRIAEKIGKEAAVIGRADQGPFSLLCLLRGTENLMYDLLDEDEDVILHALEWTTEAHSRFARAQLEAGALITSMGDAYASPNLISPKFYREFALPFEKKVVEAVQKDGAVYSIHICGDTNGVIEEMGRTGAKILEVDWKLNMAEARKKVPESVVLMGNIDPSNPMCTGNPQDVDAAVRKLIEDTKGKNIIVSSGCALGANTKAENVRAMVEAVKKYGVM